MNTKPPDAQELRFRLAMLRVETAEFRRLLRHATKNVVVMEEMVKQGGFGEPTPRRRLPWLRQSRKGQTS
jgi:tRNA-dihydrouridine synthase